METDTDVDRTLDRTGGTKSGKRRRGPKTKGRVVKAHARRIDMHQVATETGFPDAVNANPPAAEDSSLNEPVRLVLAKIRKRIAELNTSWVDAIQTKDYYKEKVHEYVPAPTPGHQVTDRHEAKLTVWKNAWASFQRVCESFGIVHVDTESIDVRPGKAFPNFGQFQKNQRKNNKHNQPTDPKGRPKKVFVHLGAPDGSVVVFWIDDLPDPDMLLWHRLPADVRSFLERDDIAKTGADVVRELDGNSLRQFIDTSDLIKAMQSADWFPHKKPGGKNKSALHWGCFLLYGHNPKGIVFPYNKGKKEQAKKDYEKLYNVNEQVWEDYKWLDLSLIYKWQRPLTDFQNMYIVNECKGAIALAMFYVAELLQRKVLADVSHDDVQNNIGDELYLRRKFPQLSNSNLTRGHIDIQDAEEAKDQAMRDGGLPGAVVAAVRHGLPDADAFEWLDAQPGGEERQHEPEPQPVPEQQCKGASRDKGKGKGKARPPPPPPPPQAQCWADEDTLELPDARRHHVSDEQPHLDARAGSMEVRNGSFPSASRSSSDSCPYTFQLVPGNDYNGPLPLKWLMEVDFQTRQKYCPHCSGTTDSNCTFFKSGECSWPSLRSPRVERCKYPFCTNNTTHLITVCPTLHSRCRLCSLRGHRASQHHLKTETKWLEVFRNFRGSGIYTQNVAVDHGWSGEDVIGHESQKAVVIRRDDGLELLTTMPDVEATQGQLLARWNSAVVDLKDLDLEEHYGIPDEKQKKKQAVSKEN